MYNAHQTGINHHNNQVVVVAVKEFENWYLADEQTVSRFFGVSATFESPEEDDDAITTIINLGIRSGHFKRFRKSKVLLAKAMVNNGFTIEQAAQHPNCPSAHYFLIRLKTLASAT